MSRNISRGNTRGQMDLIWEALESYRETCIPEGNEDYDSEWDDICTVMAWWEEDLNR